VDALRRRQPLAKFDEGLPEQYSLTSLPNLAAVRVMAFPERRVAQAHEVLRPVFSSWIYDPVPAVDDSDSPLAFKYSGKWPGTRITAEVQIVDLLVGLFWEVEHSAIYKPTPRLQGAARKVAVRETRDEVVNSLRRFEKAFEDAIRMEQSEFPVSE
jgi:hypothetical protein